MHRRSLLASTAMVLVAHGALFEALARHPLKQWVATSAVEHEPGTLVLLDRREIAALMPPTSASAPAPAPSAALGQAQAASPVDTGASSVPPAIASDAGAASPNAGMGLYRSPSRLDGPVRTRSAPDLAMVNDLPWSGLPIRLRLFIDDRGTVVEAQVLQSAEAPEVVERVRQMFLATGFTPGVEHGQPVPSYKDIEIIVGNAP